MHARQHRPSPDRRQPDPGPLSPASRAPAVPRRHPCLAPLPAPLGLRFRVLLGLGFVPPPEPRPCAHCVSIAYALLPAARVPLCRHRADPESSSRSLPSGSSARIAPTAPTARRRPRPPLALRRPRGPGWQESHRMHPFFAECAKKAPFLATSARNACFSRSRWQHPRPMHPFPGAIGRFGIHGARILPPRALFRVEEPEITHGAKMLPAPPGLSAAAACGPAERALRPAVRTRPACRMRPPAISLVPAAARAPCHLARVHRRRLTRVAFHHPHRAHRTPPSAASPNTVGGEPSTGCFLPPDLRPTHPASRALPADPDVDLPRAAPYARAHRCALAGTARPQPAPTEPRPRANRVPPTRGAVCAHPRPATRRASPCRAGPAAVPVIPAKWCGDTIAHTRKLRF